MLMRQARREGREVDARKRLIEALDEALEEFDMIDRAEKRDALLDAVTEFVDAKAGLGSWRFWAEVEREVARARAKFPAPDHLTLALAEEAGEVVKAVLDHRNAARRDQVPWVDRSPLQQAVLGELVQTAAMVLRLAEEGDPQVDLPAWMGDWVPLPEAEEGK